MKTDLTKKVLDEIKAILGCSFFEIKKTTKTRWNLVINFSITPAQQISLKQIAIIHLTFVLNEYPEKLILSITPK